MRIFQSCWLFSCLGWLAGNPLLAAAQDPTAIPPTIPTRPANILILAQAAPDQPAAPVSPATPTHSSSPTVRPTLKLGSQGAAVLEVQVLLRFLGFYSGLLNGIYQETTVSAVSAFQQAAGIQPDGIVGVETWNRLLPAPPPLTAAPTATTTPLPTTPLPQTIPSPAPSYTPITPTTPTLTPSASTSSLATSPPATSSPATSSPANSTNLPILRVGMQGAEVTQLQERLRTIGLFSGAIDGVFGLETKTAVEAAQRRFNLEADGVVGPATWEALLQGS